MKKITLKNKPNAFMVIFYQVKQNTLFKKKKKRRYIYLYLMIFFYVLIRMKYVAATV